MKDTILVIGAGGQVGSELTEKLREIYGDANVIATDVRPVPSLGERGPFTHLDVMDQPNITAVFTKYKPTIVYHLAAMLSATAEAKPKLGWDLNMVGLFNIFDACLSFEVKRIFWPSSIAVFGPTTPKFDTPQYTVMEPTTIYGISKQAGERFAEYYNTRYNLDVRSIRYPGLIGYKSLPGGGTTDYAVDIFHKAIQDKTYECFLGPETELPMMYMPDAIHATIKITDAPSEQIKIRSSYNLAAFSFTPSQLASCIQKEIPEFTITYKTDQRQHIADSWPKSILDQEAQADWNWKPQFSLDDMVRDMIKNLR